MLIARGVTETQRSSGNPFYCGGS